MEGSKTITSMVDLESQPRTIAEESALGRDDENGHKLSKSAGPESLESEALSTNKKAIRLYERAWFQRDGIIEGKILRRKKIIDTLIMTRRV